MAAVTKDGAALKFVAPELKSDRQICLAAVSQNGWALEHVADDLKADKELTLAAVRQHCGALNFASDGLKKDEEVVLAAVGWTGFSEWLLVDSWWRADARVEEAAQQQAAIA